LVAANRNSVIMLWPTSAKPSITDHIRILFANGVDRDRAIVPKNRPIEPPPEQLFPHSVVIPRANVREILVIEWDAGSIETHVVDV